MRLGWIACIAALTACGSDDSSGANGHTGGSGGVVTGGGGSGGGGASGGGSGVGGTTTGGSGGAPSQFRLALSLSPFTGTLFKNNASYSDGTTTAANETDLQKLYVAHGATEVYTRISCEKDPTTPDDHSLTTALDRAKLAKTLGLEFNPELGLWAHYGDITCQPPPDFSAYPTLVLPAAWTSITIDQVLPVFRDYGVLVANAIVATGANVNVWDIGNEIDFGFAGIAPQGISCSTPWVAPNGIDPEIGKQTVIGLLTMPEPDRITWLSAHVWPHEARALGAVAEGIKSVVPNAHFATHMSQSHSVTFARAFYHAMIDGGFALDTLGFSLYPSANADPNRIASFRDTVTGLATDFGKPVFVAEFGYPAGPTSSGPYASWTNAVPNYPITEDGQAAMLRDLAAWGKANDISGIRPWAPEVFVSGWEGFALFQAGAQFPVQARKSLGSIAEGIATGDPSSFHD